MQNCECGKEQTVVAIGYRKDRLDVRPVKFHVEDAAQYDRAPLFIFKQETKDYVKKHDGTKYGFNIAREIVDLDPGHQGMTAEEEIVVYLNGNTLDLRKCNLRVQLASDQRPARVAKPVEYGSTEHISVHEHPQDQSARTRLQVRNTELELWNRQATAGV
jgi:hypothetical protein